MSCMRRFVYRIFFSEVFEQKVRLLADCVAVLVRPTCLPLLCGHCCLPSPTTDVIIFLQEQKSFKKKELHLTKFRFFIIIKIMQWTKHNLPYHEFVIIFYYMHHIYIHYNHPIASHHLYKNYGDHRRRQKEKKWSKRSKRTTCKKQLYCDCFCIHPHCIVPFCKNVT